MISSALEMLFERLLWPVPRVRMEACRSLAQLVREEDEDAKVGLLNWISLRQLESEAVVGLSIIDAFRLGCHFDFQDVVAAVRCPSLVSDWILRRNFTPTSSLSSFRYKVSRPEPAILLHGVRSWFQRYRHSAVPERLALEFEALSQISHFPFLKQWEHEWSWLQATYPCPSADYPYFFLGQSMNLSGQFHRRQRELLISAFLRTLAFAVHTGAIPPDMAEDCALAALPLNRGLADLESVDRPDWTENLKHCQPDKFQEVAHKLWCEAEAAAGPEEVPIKVRAIDSTAEGFIEFTLQRTVGSIGYTAGRADIQSLDWIIMDEESCGSLGKVAYKVNPLHFPSKVLPVPLARCFMPRNPGAFHIELIPTIRLATPAVFQESVNIQFNSTQICLTSHNDVLSRWIHWYSNWEPAYFTGLDSSIGYLTTMSEFSFEKLCDTPGLEVATIARIRWLEIPTTYVKSELQVQTFWM